MRRSILGLLAVILLLAVVAQFVLPALIGNLVARGVAEKISAAQISATVSKRPAIAMLDGKFDNVVVSAVQANVGKVIFSDLSITLQDAALDMGVLLRDHRLLLKSVEKVELSGSITQEELARFLKANVKGVKEAVVTVDNGRVAVQANLSFGGPLSFAVQLDGRVVGIGQDIKFVTDRFQLNNVLTASIGGSMFTEVPIVDLRNLPFAVGVREIRMEKGKVAVYTDSASLAP